MPDAELDLLLSRAIDGDLSPDEERALEAYLAAHPEARARAASMEALVAKLKSLPAPEPPFALATRVTSQVAERSRGLGAVGHRFGFFLPPGLLAAGVGVIALGAVLASFLVRSAPKQVAALAKKDEGPVHVFFQEAAPKKPASAPAPSKEKAAREEAEQRPAATLAEAPRADRDAGSARKDEPVNAAKDRRARRPASSDAVAERDQLTFAPEEAAANAPSAEAPAGAASAPAPALARPAPAMAMQSRAKSAEVVTGEAGLTDTAARPFSISVVSGAGWRLKSTGAPAWAAGTFRLALDEKGGVLRVLSGAPNAETRRFLVSLSFERTAASAAGEVDVRIAAR
jgi:hypothetical protein